MAKRRRKVETSKLKCGLVMPISSCDGQSAEHWSEVKKVFEESLSRKYEISLVSDRLDVGVIHETIVVNLFDLPIVVCDVSGHNANVMLELGIRLAADKPVVIVKDDQTDFSFDVAPIKHLVYPRSLKHSNVLRFQEELFNAVESTVLASKKENYSPFLSNFKRYELKKELGTQPESDIQRIERKIDRLYDEKIVRKASTSSFIFRALSSLEFTPKFSELARVVRSTSADKHVRIDAFIELQELVNFDNNLTSSQRKRMREEIEALHALLRSEGVIPPPESRN